MVKRFRKGKSFDVLEDLKNIKKVNGKVRVVSIGIQNNTNEYGDLASEYGAEVDKNARYHFSEGTGEIYDKISRNKKINRSINNIVKGSRRSRKELDDISTEMAKVAVRDVMKFVNSGGNKVYQSWKGTNSKNLIVTGTLRNSIMGSVRHKSGRMIWEGR